MTLIKLAGFFVLTTLSYSIEGKLLLLNTDPDLKPSDKRASNFRASLEAPFDPNFWPARGRRGRREPEKPDDCFAADDYWEFQCPQQKKTRDLESGVKSDGDLMEMKTEGAKRKLASDVSDVKVGERIGQFMSSKRRRQRILPLSRFLANGNGLYYEPENPLNEKMKKQDVFWVVRGRRNFE